MYTMKQVSEITGLPYETLKFYCNQGLVPGLKRDGANRRIFDEQDISGIFCLKRLRGCGMGIHEIREFLELCRQGKSSVPERKEVLDRKKQELLRQIEEIRKSIAYIDEKQAYYDMVMAGEEEDSCSLATPREQQDGRYGG
ncbi:MAG TPA: MerR family transcriptional regulator [Candidatus Lachnoclostridium stercorigallinarum]|uniref:MerR family transcriptional regulator n=1 Tax=Candidatus Lachnoclostridium stercorigallinarum TaxID=2838634 RepID=A0A9D2GEE8_9FIRM|nr:MerR family transcriptional regulator [Candidatus Lachnoclostridium stercorigallinarum]